MLQKKKVTFCKQGLYQMFINAVVYNEAAFRYVPS